METMALSISGMVCGGCANNVKQALLGIDGVVSAEVSQPEARAEVVYDPVKVDPIVFRAAVAAAGYSVE